MKPITVLLVDGNEVVRRALRNLLELEDDLEVVGEAKNGRQAVAMVKEHHPAIILMEVALPPLNGFQATRKILEAAPDTKVLMLSVNGEEAYVQEALHCGAAGYLIKHTAADRVCHAIREVRNGNTFLSPSVPGRLHKRNRKW